LTDKSHIIELCKHSGVVDTKFKFVLLRRIYFHSYATLFMILPLLPDLTSGVVRWHFVSWEYNAYCSHLL